MNSTGTEPSQDERDKFRLQSLGISAEDAELLLQASTEEDATSCDSSALAQRMQLLPGPLVKSIYQLEDLGLSFALGNIKTVALHEKGDRPNRMFKEFLSVTNCNSKGRPGILRKVEADSLKPLHLYPHQCEAVRKLASQNPIAEDTPRKALLLLFHSMGLGKTTTGTAAIALAHSRIQDKDRKLKALIISPIQGASFHRKEVLKWLNLTESEVLLARNKDDMTDESLAAAKVVIVTFSALSAALATFFWNNPQGKQTVNRKTGAIRYWSQFEPLRKPRSKDLKKHPEWDPNAPPPVHPIFCVPHWDIVIIDECQHANNSTTWYAQACRRVCSRAVNRVLGSGTPVRGKVSEMAGLFWLADCQPDKFQQNNMWIPSKSAGRGIRRQILDEAHERFVHVKDADQLMVESTRVRVEFDPYVGRLADGSIDVTAISEYNHAVDTATSIARTIADNPEMARSMMGRLISCVTKTEQFNGNIHLGHLVGRRWDKNIDGDDSAKNPSEQIKMAYRLIKSRQDAGHVRVLVYSQHHAYHHILQRYCSTYGGVGKIFMITGRLSGPRRDKVVVEFLKCPRAILCITAAGAEAINLAPGCEVVISFGSFPWSPQELRQAEHRVRRLTQTEPVELIELVPRGQTGKLDHLHQDKARLVDGLVRNNFSRFKNANSESAVWRERLSIAKSLRRVNNEGQHVVDPGIVHDFEAWLKGQMRLPFEEREPVPEHLEPAAHVSTLAYNTPLPPVTYPAPASLGGPGASEEDDDEAISEVDDGPSEMSGVFPVNSAAPMASQEDVRAMAVVVAARMDAGSDSEDDA